MFLYLRICHHSPCTERHHHPTLGGAESRQRWAHRGQRCWEPSQKEMARAGGRAAPEAAAWGGGKGPPGQA